MRARIICGIVIATSGLVAVLLLYRTEDVDVDKSAAMQTTGLGASESQPTEEPKPVTAAPREAVASEVAPSEPPATTFPPPARLTELIGAIRSSKISIPDAPVLTSVEWDLLEKDWNALTSEVSRVDGELTTVANDLIAKKKAAGVFQTFQNDHSPNGPWQDRLDGEYVSNEYFMDEATNQERVRSIRVQPGESPLYDQKLASCREARNTRRSFIEAYFAK